MSTADVAQVAPRPTTSMELLQARLAAAAAWLRMNRVDLLAMAGPALVLGALASYNLGATSFWRDEISSVVFAHASIPDLLTIIDRERRVAGLPNMATYYLVLHFWLVVGETEARVRLLSVLAGVATIVPIYLTAKRIGGWVAGLVAGALFAVIPYVVHYSQDARGYSMSMLAAAALTWLVIKATERQTVGWWLAYGITAALGLYVHFFVALVIAVHGIWVLAARRMPPWRALVAGALPVVIAAAPLPYIVLQYGTKHGWIDPLTFRRMGLALSELAGNTGALVAFVVAICVVLVVHRRNPLAWLLVAVVLVPLAVTAGMSTVKPLFVPRYLIVVLPAMATVAGVAVASLRPVPARAVAAVAIGAVLLWSLPTAYPALDRQDWRSAARFMSERMTPEDRFVIQADGRRQLEYYLGRHGITMPPSEDVWDVLADSAETQVWVFVSDEGSPNAIRRALEEEYDLVVDHSWGRRIRLILFAPATTGLSQP